jgi:hypothetical protein
MGGVVPSSRWDLPLLLEGQMPSQEQDLRAEGRARAEQEREEKNSICDQIGDPVKQRIQGVLCVGKESKHGLSGWHRVGRAERYFLLAGLVWGFLAQGSRTNKCQHLCQMGAG